MQQYTRSDLYIGFSQNKDFRPGMKAIVRFDEFVSTPAEFIGMYVTVVLVYVGLVLGQIPLT